MHIQSWLKLAELALIGWLGSLVTEITAPSGASFESSPSRFYV